MSSLTARLQMTMPVGTELWDLDVWNGNLLIMDGAAAWAKTCTAATHPGLPNEGDIILETDTDKVFIRSGTAWDQIGTSFTGVPIVSGKQLNIGGSTSAAPIAVLVALANDAVLSTRVPLDTSSKFAIKGDGKHEWGDGNVAADTNLYRSAANVLKTDDILFANSFLENSGAVTVSNVQAVAGTTTSVSYVATLTSGTTCSTTFVAPSSGKVIIKNTAEALNSGAGYSRYAIEVRTGAVIGSGTAIITAGDDDSGGNTGTSSVRATCETMLSGLTAGSTYNLRQLFRVQSGTGTFLRKNVIVSPQAA